MKKMFRPLALAAAVSTSLMGASMFTSVAEAGSMTGNIGVTSKYILRGMTNTPESDIPAVQGGIDWSSDSGFFLGYWGSTLNYNPSGTYNTETRSFENDFYGGYANSIGGLDYSIGLVQYYYMGATHNSGASSPNGMEAYGSLGYKGVTFGFHTLVKDASWGNKGDTYWQLGYSHDLPMGFNLGGSLEYYTYRSDTSKITYTKSTAFRDFTLSLTHPIGNTGANMAINYIIGGEDGNGNKQKNAVTLGISYGFDIK